MVGFAIGVLLGAAACKYGSLAVGFVVDFVKERFGK